jgi:histidinol-phosphatase (PHP family)
MARSGAAAEINTGGLNRQKATEPYPSLALVRLFREKGVPLIVTSDAHKAAHLGGHYEEARQTMLDGGYTHAALFQGRQGGKPVWREDPL